MTDAGLSRDRLLSVATWNLWWRFGDDPDARMEAITATLRDVDADVVCLQEVWGREGNDDAPAVDQAETIAAALGLEPVRFTTGFHRGWSFGNAILSRHPVLASGIDQLPNALPGEAERPGFRTMTWAELDTPAGRWPVITAHLAYRADESALRRAQLTAIIERVGELRGGEESPPVIVAGDFNAAPDSDELRAATGAAPPLVPGVLLSDCWTMVRDDLGLTWDPIVPYLADSILPRRRLDYICVSWPRPRRLGAPRSAALFGDHDVDGVWPSDHLGVVVELDMRPPVPRPSPTF